MAGLNHIREAYQSIYKSQIDERMDPEERALRRAEVADKKASRMDAKVGAKYAGSEAKSAEREDKKSKGKHIHGMADSYQPEGEVVDEKKDDSYLETDMNKRRKNNEKAIEDMKKTKGYADMVKAARKHFEEAELEEKRGLWDNIHAKRKRGERPAKPGEKGYPKTLNVEETEIVEGIKKARENVGASRCWTGKKLGNPPTKMKGGKEVPNCVPEALVYGGEKKEPEDKRMTVTASDRKANTKAWQKYKAGDPSYKAASHVGEETVLERVLDTAEKGEKERLVKGMKKSAADFKKRYGERAKSVMYATATKMAKHNMDTSKSDRRYAVEETSMEENADLENRKKGPRTPSQLAKREKLNKLINDIRSKKQGDSK